MTCATAFPRRLWKMSPRAVAAQLARAYRCHGLPGTWSLVRTKLRPDAKVLLLLGLSQPDPTLLPQVAGRMEHRFASRDEVASLPEEIRKADAQARLARGERCLLQLIDGRLAGVVWLSTSPVVELYRGVSLSLPADAVYTYRTWTDPAWRGRGLQARRHLAVLAALRDEGRSRLVCFVEDTNFASLRGAFKSGCRPVGTVRASRSDRSRPRVRIQVPAWVDLTPFMPPMPASSGNSVRL